MLYTIIVTREPIIIVWKEIEKVLLGYKCECPLSSPYPRTSAIIIILWMCEMKNGEIFIMNCYYFVALECERWEVEEAKKHISNIHCDLTLNSSSIFSLSNSQCHCALCWMKYWKIVKRHRVCDSMDTRTEFSDTNW